jgi:3'(2'), 5'-bisphosphate nucleotidase
MNDHQLARDVAASAGALLMATRAELVAAGAEEKQLRSQGDLRAHGHIVARLAQDRPDDVVLSEEGADNEERLAASRVWIVDPLDGTREYAEGRSDWAVHVALWESGTLAAGAVALPGEDVTLATDGHLPRPGDVRQRPRMVVSRTRPAGEASRLAGRLDLELVPMGSAGAKAMAVVRGEVDLYVHSGGQYEWDSAAPVAVAAAAGFHTSRLDGSPLEYNRDNPYLPDLLICHPELAEPVLAELS